jgi:hypothetical protein
MYSLQIKGDSQKKKNPVNSQSVVVYVTYCDCLATVVGYRAIAVLKLAVVALCHQ